jgi:hypothetical protein
MGSLYTEVHDADLHGHIANPRASFAYSCWLLAGGGATPAEADLLRHKLDWLLADMMILRLDASGELVYAHYGATIAAAAGFDMTGKRVADFRGVMGGFYRAVYARVLAEMRPLVTIHRLGSYSERPLWERVVMPVRRATGDAMLYVFNSVRKLGDDFAAVCARSKEAGFIALQFERDSRGVVIDAMITGANLAALAMTGRRLDEMLDRSIRECFPGVVHLMLWDRYLEVARTREEQSFTVDYALDGLDALFDVRLLPFRDGVAIEFRTLPRSGAAAA